MGTGGDELLHPGRHAHLAAVLVGRERPQPRDIARAAFAVAPRPLRRRRRRREATWIDCPWLRPAAHLQLVAAYAAVAAREPVRRKQWVRWTWRMRAIQLTVESMETLAHGLGSQLVSPFLEPEVVAAYAAYAAKAPPATRTVAFRKLCGALLPDDVVERRTKATFDGAFWCRHSREFAMSLTPEEVDSELVDGEAALAFWAAGGSDTAGPIPSSTLLQALWLERAQALAVERGEKRGPGLVERVPVATPAER
jgi:asparagine synthase (glutamine-hydrolysing)